MRLALAEARASITVAVGEMERWWTTPSAATIRAARDRFDEPDDVDDRPVLAAARAAGAGYLLSQDARSFSHGRCYLSLVGGPEQQLVCWDPDSFLTSFFQAEAYVYEVVSEECAAIWVTLRRGRKRS